jgi:hypothetical protein
MGQGSEAAKGALGGAATGAAIGSVVPGWGTVIGAGIGGLVGGAAGWFGGGDKGKKPMQYQDRDQMQALIRGGSGEGGDAGYWAQDVTHFQAPQVAASGLKMWDDPFRRAQLQQMGQLQGIASGQQQGAGELAVQRQAQQALAAQQAQARMARGGNAALAYRNAAGQSAAIGSSAAGAARQAALQDQMNAQGLLSGLSAQGRGADINVSGQNANLEQQANIQNAGLAQQNQVINSGNYMGLLSQLNQMNGNQLAASAGQPSQPGLGAQLLSTGGQALGAYLANRK